MVGDGERGKGGREGGQLRDSELFGVEDEPEREEDQNGPEDAPVIMQTLDMSNRACCGGG